MGEKSNERIALEKRADELAVSFAPNIGDTKLAERVAAAEAAAQTGKPDPGEAPPPAPAPAGPAQAGAGDSAPAASPALPIAIEVTGPKRGRWRVGRRFGPRPVMILIDELTEEDQAALASDPKLTVIAREIT